MSDFRIRGVIDADAKRFQSTIAGVLKSFGGVRTAHKQTAATTRLLEHQTRDLNRQLDAQSRKLAVLTLQFTAFRNAMRTLGLRTAIAGFAALTASVGSLAGGLALAAAQAATLAAGLGVLAGAGLGAVVQGAATAALALDGVGKALSTTGTEHEKALAKLTKPARAFVGELRGLQMEMREVKLLAQTGLFEGLTRGLQHAKPLIEPIKQVVFDTAQALGYLGERIGEVAGRRANDLKALGERNVVTLRRLGDAAINSGEALVDVFRAADPFIGHVTRGIVTLSKELKKGAASARGDGSLGHFFFELRQDWDTWTATFGNVGGSLLNIFRAARDPARDMADAIKDVTQRWEDFTGSEVGQTKLGEFFTASNRVLGSMAGLLGDVVSLMARLTIAGADNAVRFWDGLRVHALPVLEQLALLLNDGLFTHIMDLGGALATLVSATLPGLRPWADALGEVVKVLVAWVEVAGQAIDQLPTIAKLPAALLIGAGTLAVWKKLTDLLALALLRMRMFFGLAREGPVWGPGLRQIFSAGGRNQSAQGADVAVGGRGRGRPPVAGGGGLQTIAGGVGQGAGRAGFNFASPAAAQQLLLWNREAERAAKAGEKLGRVAKAYGGPINALTGLGRGIGIVHTPTGDRSAQTQRFVPNEQNRGILAGTSAVRQSTARQRLDAQHFDNTGRSSITRMAENIGGATNAGVRKGMTMAKPVLAGAFSVAAASGLIAAFSSDSRGLRNRIKDFFSGATFGLMKSAGEQQAENAKRLAGIAKGGTVDFSKIGQKFDLGLAMRKGGLDPKLLQTKFSIDTKQGIAALREVTEALRRTGQLSDDTASSFAQAGRKMAAGLRQAQVKEWTDSVNRNWAEMARSSQGRLTDIRNTVSHNTTIIKQRLGADTREGKDALAANFRRAATEVERAMKRGQVSVKTGTAEIRKLMVAALTKMGFTEEQANRKAGGGLRNGQVDQSPGQRQPGQGTAPRARGGLHSLPGQPGRDSVPGQIGGQRIVAAPGEDVAVFTRHQRRVVDERLSDMGGLPGLFRNVRTPHGRPKGFAQGGMVTGDTDYNPAVGQALEAMAAATRTRISVQSGGRTMAEQQALYDRYLSGTGNLAARPNRNAPHVAGRAADISPGRERFGAVADRFGLRFTVPSESWHIELVKLIGKLGARGANAGAGAAMVVPVLKDVLSGLPGTIGNLADTGLSRVREAAQTQLAQLAASAGGGGDLSGFKGGGSASANRSLGQRMAAAFGWSGGEWSALDQLWTGESGWQNVMNQQGSGATGIPQALPGSKMASAGKDWATNVATQIKWGLGYIKERYGSPSRALAAWLARSPHWYDEGGMLDPVFAAAGINLVSGDPPLPPRGTRPGVNPSDAVTPGSQGDRDARGKKKKPKPKAKAKRKPKPFAGRHPLPNVDNIKAGKHKAKGKKKKKGLRYPKLAGGSDVAEAILEKRLPDYNALYETPMSTADNLLTNLAGRYDLSSEEPIVSLFDSGSFGDLSAFWAAHPDLARTYREQTDSFDVVNTGGYMVQGKFVPGINQHVNELLGLLGVHTGSGDATGKGGQIGRLMEYIGALTKRGIPESETLRDDATRTLRRLKKHWTHWHTERADDNRELVKLKGGGRSWEQRIDDNDARVKALQDYKRDIRADAVGHRLTEADKKNLVKADQKIADLHDDNDKLRTDKPAPTNNKPRKRKGESTKDYKGRVARWEHDERARKHRISRVTNHRNTALLAMDELAASRDKWNTDGGLAKDWTERRATYRQSVADQRAKLVELQQIRQPAEQLEVMRIAQEMGDWKGTLVPLPKVDASAGDQARTDEMNALLKQQNEELRKTLALSQSELGVFKGFSPLLAGGLVGKFLHGGVIPQTGLALVHQNETVLPAPDGPFANRAAQALATSGDTRMQVVFQGVPDGFIKLIDSRINAVAPKVIDRKLGRDSRTLTFAPGR